MTSFTEIDSEDNLMINDLQHVYKAEVTGPSSKSLKGTV